MGDVIRFPQIQPGNEKGNAPTRLVPANEPTPGPAAVGIDGNLFFGEIENASKGKVRFRRKGKRYVLKSGEVDIFRVLLILILAPFSFG